MDNKDKVGGQDRNRINVNEDYEVKYWSEKFGISAEELKRAVEDSGTTQASEVEQFLQRSNSSK